MLWNIKYTYKAAKHKRLFYRYIGHFLHIPGVWYLLHLTIATGFTLLSEFQNLVSKALIGWVKGHLKMTRNASVGIRSYRLCFDSPYDHWWTTRVKTTIRHSTSCISVWLSYLAWKNAHLTFEITSRYIHNVQWSYPA